MVALSRNAVILFTVTLGIIYSAKVTLMKELTNCRSLEFQLDSPACTLTHERAGCQQNRSDFEIACKNGHCTIKYLTCNEENTCVDDQDENWETYGFMPCTAVEFRCGTCINKDTKCNGRVDGGNVSDGTAELTSKRKVLAAAPRTLDSCLVPSQPENGRFIGLPKEAQLHPGKLAPELSMLLFTCDDNYTLSSMKSVDVIVCANKIWNKEFPTCVGKCPARVSDSANIICKYNDKYVNCSLPMPEGSQMIMNCPRNYKPIGTSPNQIMSVCRNGVWDHEMLKCELECGRSEPIPRFIVGGGASELSHTFPWHVGVYFSSSNGSYEQACSGSLVTMNVVLSAAHCFTDDNGGALSDTSDYTIVAGKYYRSLDSSLDEDKKQIEKIKLVKVSPDYKGVQNNYRDDIAIVVLQRPFMFVSGVVTPVCVDWTHEFEKMHLHPESTGEVIGWGFTESQGNPSDRLLHLYSPFIENQRCYKVLPVSYYPYLTFDKFCAGYTNGSNVCKGDSGGGLVFHQKSNNRYYIQGIVSNGVRIGFGCDLLKYSLFTKVSLFLNIINETISENKIETLPLKN